MKGPLEISIDMGRKHGGCLGRKQEGAVGRIPCKTKGQMLILHKTSETQAALSQQPYKVLGSISCMRSLREDRDSPSCPLFI